MFDRKADEQALALRFAHVALPADAISCTPWTWHGGDDWRRRFLTREWDVSGMWMRVAGEQYHHGEVNRWLRVGGVDHCTAADRRNFAAALVDAGELLHMLNASAAPESGMDSRAKAYELEAQAAEAVTEL